MQQPLEWNEHCIEYFFFHSFSCSFFYRYTLLFVKGYSGLLPVELRIQKIWRPSPNPMSVRRISVWDDASHKPWRMPWMLPSPICLRSNSSISIFRAEIRNSSTNRTIQFKRYDNKLRKSWRVRTKGELHCWTFNNLWTFFFLFLLFFLLSSRTLTTDT